MTKKTSRRDKYTYPAVEKGQNLKSRQEAIDDVRSYWDQLNGSEKEWMNKFMAEYNNADFRHDNPLHTGELELECYKRNNDRNADVYTREMSQNKLKFVEKHEDFEKMDVDVFSKPVKKRRSKKKSLT